MLEISHLTKTYAGGIRALDGVDLAIREGMFGLLGPNGAGKSTLMRSLATLQRPDDGRIALDGHDIFDDPTAHRRRLGYLPQDFGVYPGVSALELLDHIARLKGLGDRRRRARQVEDLLARTNLWDVRKRAVSHFSGGMRRRFGIAQALLGSPRLIIVDEPTAGLDPEERHRAYDLLAEVGENTVLLLSTHIVEDVRQLCPDMAMLVGGRIVRGGAPVTLIDELAGRVWRKTVDHDALEALRARLTVLTSTREAGRIHVHVLSDTCPDAGFVPLPPSLEHVYFTALAADQATRSAA